MRYQIMLAHQPGIVDGSAVEALEVGGRWTRMQFAYIWGSIGLIRQEHIGMHGKKVWFFPDGDLPPAGDSEPCGHESLVIFNPNDADADVTISVYYIDREPDLLKPQRVPARRVRCIRMDEPIDGDRVPFGQYALKLESTTPVICQIGRMDVRQPNLAYYTVMGFPA